MVDETQLCTDQVERRQSTTHPGAGQSLVDMVESRQSSTDGADRRPSSMDVVESRRSTPLLSRWTRDSPARQDGVHFIIVL
jgi:hypothetical protein